LNPPNTLGVIGKAGIGTPHMDGNTRLCTATAAAALKETFGSDGQPGSYYDIDETDCLLHVGHNMAETDTVLWMRVLDRRRGPNPPKLIAIDPRETPTTREADIHLAPKPGTNVPVLNGLINLIIQQGAIDQTYTERHTVGFDQLKETVSTYTPERVEELSGIPARDLIAAGQILGQAKTLGGVDGFDEDEAESKGNDGAVVLGRLLAAQRHPLEALELAHELLDPSAGAIERFREEGRPVLGR
jgi:ferredoxin-nitrate reductase